MSFVYWLSDCVGRNIVKGADKKTPIPTTMVRWIRQKGSPSLIINGGDVYRDGEAEEFAEFLKQMDNDLTLMCETPGNHDWRNDPDLPETGRIPRGYETFWRSHPESKQPVDVSKKGGARYDHFIDIDGWRLIFLDTGDYDDHPWPAGDPQRVTWLENSLQPGRANMVFAHHSRLSCGRHGDNDGLDVLWKKLFDSSGKPRVVFTLAGHDHNVNGYGPRSRNNPKGASVSFEQGIYVFVNGAGGSGHNIQKFGSQPDLFFDDTNFCVTRIHLVDPKSVDVDVLSFGTEAKKAPAPIAKSLVKIRL